MLNGDRAIASFEEIQKEAQIPELTAAFKRGEAMKVIETSIDIELNTEKSLNGLIEKEVESEDIRRILLRPE